MIHHIYKNVYNLNNLITKYPFYIDKHFAVIGEGFAQIRLTQVLVILPDGYSQIVSTCRTDNVYLIFKKPAFSIFVFYEAIMVSNKYQDCLLFHTEHFYLYDW